MKNEMELLRKSAGLPINESTSKVRTLDLEADLLREFSSFLSGLKRIKERIDRPYGYGPGPYGPGPYGALRDENSKPDIDRLRTIAKEKMGLVDEAISEVFGKAKEEEEESEDDE